MKEFKFKTSFSSKINCVISKEQNKHLAEASINRLKKLVPDVDFEKNMDLLPFAGNAAVVNTINLNDDGMTTSVALAIYKYFNNKYVNIEHDRSQVVGCILNVGFSEFGTDKILTEEEVKDLTKPFNLTVGGIIWRIVNEGLADFVESASDPTSENYLKASISWEVGFDEEEFILIKGKSRNTEDGKILTDEKEIALAKKALRSYGGTGVYEDAHVYRLIKGDALPLGIGITENPAANVKGIVTASEELLTTTDEATKEIDKFSQLIKDTVILEITKAKESGILKESVNSNTNQQILNNNEKLSVNNTSIRMKISKIEELNDEAMKEVKASDIQALFSSSLKEASDKWVAEKSAQEKAVADLRETNEKIVAEANKAKQDLEEVTKQVNQLKADVEKREKEEKFNTRMAKLDESFDLDADERKEIAEDIKDLDETAYAKYEKKLNVYMKAKRKEAKASVKNETVENVVDEAIEKGKKETAAVSNSTSAEPKGFDKYKDSFSLEKGFKITK